MTINLADVYNSTPWPYLPCGLAGYTVLESNWCTIPKDKEVARSWTERLFSRPWHPWVRTKIIVEQLPDPDVYVMGTQIIGHPATIQQLKESLLQGV